MWSIIALTQGTEEALIWSRPSFSISKGFKVFVLKWIVWIWTLTTCSHLRVTRQKENISSPHHCIQQSQLILLGKFHLHLQVISEKIENWKFLMALLFLCFPYHPFPPTFVIGILWWYFSAKILACIHLSTSL